jgi:hypothetical protein
MAQQLGGDASSVMKHSHMFNFGRLLAGTTRGNARVNGLPISISTIMGC